MPTLLDLVQRILRQGKERKAQPKPEPAKPAAPELMSEEERDFLQALHEGSAQESQERAAAAPPTQSERERFLAGEWVETPASSNVGRIQWSPETRLVTVGYKHKDTDEMTYWWYGPVTAQQALDFYDSASRGSFVWDHYRVRGTRHDHQIPAGFISGPPGKNQRHIAARRQRRRRR